jgi:hypothetical protein
VTPSGFHTISRRHGPAPDAAREKLPADDHRQRVAHARIVERRLLRVERQVEDAEGRRDVEFVLERLAHEGELVGRGVVVAVDLAGAEAEEGGGAVVDRSDDLLVDLNVARGVEMRILDQDGLVVRREGGEPEGAVADEIAGPSEGPSEFGDVARVERSGSLMGDDGEKIRRRPLEGPVADRPDAERCRRRLALGDRFGVPDWIIEVRVSARRSPDRGAGGT